MTTNSINLGKVLITPRGAWDSDTIYKQLDIVYLLDGSYIAKKDNQGVPVSDESTWQIVAGRGPAGTGNVSVVETNLQIGKQYLFVPSASNKAEGHFEEFNPENFNQMQADWNQSENDQPDYINNKPSIPSKTSDLENDADYIDRSEIEGIFESKESKLVHTSGNETIKGVKTFADESLLVRGRQYQNKELYTHYGAPSIAEIALEETSLINQMEFYPIEKIRIFGSSVDGESPNEDSWDIVPSNNDETNKLKLVGGDKKSNIRFITRENGEHKTKRICVEIDPAFYCWLNELMLLGDIGRATCKMQIWVMNQSDVWNIYSDSTNRTKPSEFWAHISHPNLQLTPTPSATQLKKIRVIFYDFIFNDNAGANVNFTLWKLKWFGVYPSTMRRPYVIDEKKNVKYNAKVVLGENPSNNMDATTKYYVDQGFQAKEAGKGLSSNDYTTAEKEKLESVEVGAQKNKQALHKTISLNTTDWEVIDGIYRARIPQSGNDPDLVVGTEVHGGSDFSTWDIWSKAMGMDVVHDYTEDGFFYAFARREPEGEIIYKYSIRQ